MGKTGMMLLVQTALLAGQAPATPGPEHQVIASLAGRWDVRAVGAGGEPTGATGKAHAALRLGGRFLDVQLGLDGGIIREAVYTFGFDRRHGVYTVVAMDDTGTYAVSGRGVRIGDRISMYGTDDDPVMASLGFEKAFAIVLHLRSADQIAIETRLVDTRTEARTEQSFVTFELRR